MIYQNEIAPLISLARISLVSYWDIKIRMAVDGTEGFRIGGALSQK